MSRVLLSGNEAIARGAWEAGARIGVGYPGTPSTEALERFAALEGVIAQWAPNEKVALEVAIGASMAGARAFVTMKHVGVNVAADPLFTLSYTGVGGGLVLLAADDPGMHSSQNEQDSRNYAAFAKAPMLEPADSAEAREFTKHAYELSEKLDLPVMIRSTVRLSHAKGLVELGERVEAEGKPYVKDPTRWVMMPAMARARRVELDRRVAEATEYAETTPLTRAEMRDTSVGVVCAGVVYQYVREALPTASVLKLEMSFPLPPERLRAFADSVDTLYVIEEADDYLARNLRALGIDVATLDVPRQGELSPGIIRRAMGEPEPTLRERVEDLPARPPLMCPGCPHRTVFDTLRRLRAVVTGDIGCYTLGALPPTAAMDSCVCMGASISMAHGFQLAGGAQDGRPVIGVIGDSTFAHSGITGVLNTAYNQGEGVIAILDNRITAMTGHQGNPVNGKTLQGAESVELELEPLCRALGVPRVRTVDAQDLAAVEAALREEIAAEEFSVVVFRAPCALLIRSKDTPVAVDDELCTACGRCIKLGCPAIARDAESGKAEIDVTVCVGCGQCEQVCRFDAIVSAGPSCDIGRGP